jgi:hypothetical protein
MPKRRTPKRRITKSRTNKPRTSKPRSGPKQHEEMLRRWFNEVWNKQRGATIHELMAPQAEVVTNARTIGGTAEFEAFFRQFHKDFTNLDMKIRKVFATDTMGACHWHLTARHVATSKPVEITGTTVVQIKNGKFTAGWQNYDELALSSQIS